MTSTSGLDPAEAGFVRERFGVSLDQVRRDHLISLILAAISPLAESLLFFGGTALARTHLPDGRLSEDIDLIALTDRSQTASRLVPLINRTLLPRYGRLTWSAQLADVRDMDPVVLRTDDGLSLRLQLLNSDGYPRWPTEVRELVQRYGDASPATLPVPTLDSFVAWKTATWCDRGAARDLFDLWALAELGAIGQSASDLFVRFGPTGATPKGWMFDIGPTEEAWRGQLAGQTRLTVRASEALTTVREAWSAAGTLGPHV